MNRLRKPGARFADRPVGAVPARRPGFARADRGERAVLGEPWHLPHTVAVVAPLLATAGSAALRLAASRVFATEELLQRPIVRLDVHACAPALAGKRVLITGGAGSIGAELARQVLAVGPASVLAVDMNETGLFELEADLASRRRGRSAHVHRRCGRRAAHARAVRARAAARGVPCRRLQARAAGRGQSGPGVRQQRARHAVRVRVGASPQASSAWSSSRPTRRSIRRASWA